MCGRLSFLSQVCRDHLTNKYALTWSARRLSHLLWRRWRCSILEEIVEWRVAGVCGDGYGFSIRIFFIFYCLYIKSPFHPVMALSRWQSVQ